MFVKVAVRVRPCNALEIQQNHPLCIVMNENRTILYDSNKTKDYDFDYSFWSHDGFEVEENGYRKPLPNSRYADQKTIFNTINQDTLQNLFQGQNCCIVVFGQKGSGRSYTLKGTDENQGLIYNFLKGVFHQISERQTNNTKYEVFTSMLFVYNEKIYDQLSPTDFQELKIRENAVTGVKIENLIKELIDSPESFEGKMKKGINRMLKFQTMMGIHLQLMNTIVQIEIKETKILGDQVIENVNKVNLCDVTYLEKSYKKYINLCNSLPTLGEVICSILRQSQSQDKKFYPPYRCSKLTRILQESLNQKQKIFLILTISPTINNYEQTKCGLRFANKFMKIKNAGQKVFLNVNDTQTQIQTQTKVIQSTGQQQIENPQDQILKQNTQFNEKIDKTEEMQSANGIQAIISYKDGIIELKPISKQSCEQMFINNQQIKELTTLSHNDRITIGKTTSLLVQYFETEQQIQSDSNIAVTQQDKILVSQINPISEEDNKNLEFQQN